MSDLNRNPTGFSSGRLNWTSEFRIEKQIIYQRDSKQDWHKSSISEIDDRFCQAFPKLYHQRGLPCTHTCMCWGFDIGPGWYGLVWELSSKIESLIIKWMEENPDAPYHPSASQVKEKYGSLRVYMDFSTTEMDHLMAEAEALSEKTCEKCGTLGSMVDENGWSICLCRGCSSERR